MQYENIIHLPRPLSKKHYPMSVYNRAAQFAAFAALSGYGEEINETARLTNSKLELSEDKAADLDAKTQLLIDHAAEQPEIEIEYFIPDKRKNGGAYHKIKGSFRWYDSGNASIVLSDGTSISVGNIYSIEGQIFEQYTENETGD